MTNWEHTGVPLDVQIDASEALIKAQIMALENNLLSQIPSGIGMKETEEKLIELKHLLSK